MRFVIIANPDKPKAKIIVPQIIAWLDERGIEILDESEAQSADIVLALGGDGTFLKAARIVAKHDIPILGINLGSFGFLTDIPSEGVFSALKNVLQKRYKIEERIALSVNFEDVELFALNDVVVSTNEIGRMINLRVSVNEEYLSDISSDGLIISTPTGSTAYSLSAGGPIVYPLLEAIILTPICAHTLSMRPLILSSESRITIKPTEGKSIVCCDGQVKITVKEGTELKVNKAEHKVKLIKLKISFYEILRRKLGWNKR